MMEKRGVKFYKNNKLYQNPICTKNAAAITHQRPELH